MTNRRTFMRVSGAALCAAAVPSWALEHAPLPARRIPGSDEDLSIIGLGNSSAFRAGDAVVSRELLDIYLSRGGNYVDASGPSAEFLGGLGQAMAKTEQMFLGNYVDPAEYSAMRDRVAVLADAQGKSALDLVHTRDIDGFRAHHDDYMELKENGQVRFIGIARTGSGNFSAIARLIDDGLVDFIQVNYSMLEPEAEAHLLPLAQDKGVAVTISRPFLNGRYFAYVDGHELPGWVAEFDCNSWAQFSLKYILANPAVNCVLTETTNPDHLLDNLGAGFGVLPDETMRRRMSDYMHAIVVAR